MVTVEVILLCPPVQSNIASVATRQRPTRVGRHSQAGMIDRIRRRIGVVKDAHRRARRVLVHAIDNVRLDQIAGAEVDRLVDVTDVVVVEYRFTGDADQAHWKGPAATSVRNPDAEPCQYKSRTKPGTRRIRV